MGREAGEVGAEEQAWWQQDALATGESLPAAPVLVEAAPPESAPPVRAAGPEQHLAAVAPVAEERPRTRGPVLMVAHPVSAPTPARETSALVDAVRLGTDRQTSRRGAPRD